MQLHKAPLTRVQRQAYEAVRRACNAPLDTLQLREELAARVRPALPSDAGALATSDPELGLLSHAIYWNYPAAALAHYLAEVYPSEGAVKFIDLGLGGTFASTKAGPVEADWMAAHGFGSKLSFSFADRGMIWGAGCLVRGRESPQFSEEDEAFVRLLAPEIAAGLRRAALLEVARDADTGDVADDSAAPGVALYELRGRLLLRDARVADYLADMGDPPSEPNGAPVLPQVIAAALTHLRLRLQSGGAAPVSANGAGIRARGKSGRWYTVHASAAEAVDAVQAGQALVVVAPMGGGERGGVLARLYGLTPREREIIVRIARGESGKQIAAAVGLSAHTVQAHINNACVKVGARGRKELLAKLFFDGATARMAS
jgi:DNA-binding CsgD family transcriptional regulator